ADDNRNQLIQGQRDTYLNDLGISQAQLTGKFLKQLGLRFDQIWSSDLRRALKTAQTISDQLGDSIQVKTDVRLRERFLGDLEGKRRGTIQGESTAESLTEVLERLMSFWQDELLNRLGCYNRVIVVSHGAALRTLLELGLIERLNYIDREIGHDQIRIPRRRFGNCSITEVVIDGPKSGRVLYVGRDSHLSGILPGTVTNADEVA
ncbi:histidine phosphatase superfamily, partial [Phakopsora pachyrhizi]